MSLKPNTLPPGLGRSLALASIYICAWVTAVGCDDAPATSPAPKPEVKQEAKKALKAPAKPAPPLPDGARIFVDLSTSMQGYAGGDSGGVESVHRFILQGISAAGAAPVEYCEILKKGDTRCGIKPNPNHYRTPKVYREGASPIAGVLFPPRRDPSGERTVEKSPIDERRISVIITDGLEATTARTQPDGQSGDCVPGPDVACLQRALAERAQQGYGVWMIAVSLRFRGKVFAERGLDQVMFARVRDHLNALREQPEWSGVDFEATKLREEQSTGNHLYEYVGVRPLIVFVLSRDIKLGREVTQHVMKRLESEHVATPKDRLKSIELAPYDSGRYAFKTLTHGEVEKAQGAVLPSGKPRRYEELNALVLPLECRGQGVARLNLYAVEDQPTTPTPPAGLKPKLGVKMMTPIQSAFIPPKQVKPGHFQAALKCLYLSKGETRLEIDLLYQIDLIKDQINGFESWSSQNTWENPERAYRLKNIVDGVLSECTREAEIQDKAIFLIKKDRD
ncbi:hypothetical protein KJ940_17260 [Myxococcota bacterium]|nr:hypothetical protein [Myxococcota bacterium]